MHMLTSLRPALALLMVSGFPHSAQAQSRGRYPVAVLQSPQPKGARVESGLANSQNVPPQSRVLIYSGDRVLGPVAEGRELIPLLSGDPKAVIHFDPLPRGAGRLVRFDLPIELDRALATCKALQAGLEKVRPSLTLQRSRGLVDLDPDAVSPLLADRGWPEGEAVLLPGQILILSWPMPFQRIDFYRKEGSNWVLVGAHMDRTTEGFLAEVKVDSLPLAAGPLAWLPKDADPSSLGQHRLRLATAQEQDVVKRFLGSMNLNLAHPSIATATALNLLTQMGTDLRWLALQHAAASPQDALQDAVLTSSLAVGAQ